MIDIVDKPPSASPQCAGCKQATQGNPYNDGPDAHEQLLEKSDGIAPERNVMPDRL
jgi:hypothetical protein